MNSNTSQTNRCLAYLDTLPNAHPVTANPANALQLEPEWPEADLGELDMGIQLHADNARPANQLADRAQAGPTVTETVCFEDWLDYKAKHGLAHRVTGDGALQPGEYRLAVKW